MLRLGQCFIDLPLWFVSLDGPVPFREEDHGRIVALIDHSRHQFLIISVGLKRFYEVIGMDEADEYLEEFHHQAVL